MREDAPEGPEISVPVVDLGALDQDELLRLSASQVEVSLELVDFNIDRRVFNESKAPTFSPDRRPRQPASHSNGGKGVDLAEEAALSRYLAQLHGNWVSQRKKEKIIAAKGFPQGWTVRVGLSFRDGRCFLKYHNYTSPEGKTWPSFKAAAEYLIAKLYPDFRNAGDEGERAQAPGEGKPVTSVEQQQQAQDMGSGSEKPDPGDKDKSLSARNVKLTERGFLCLACGKCFKKKAQCVGHQMMHTRKRGEPATAAAAAVAAEDETNPEKRTERRRVEEVKRKRGEPAGDPAGAPGGPEKRMERVGGEQQDQEQEQRREMNSWAEAEQEQRREMSSSAQAESCQVCKKQVMENPVFCSWCEREYHSGCVQAPVLRDWTCVICNFVS